MFRALPCTNQILSYLDFFDLALICLVVECLTNGQQPLWKCLGPSQFRRIFLYNTASIRSLGYLNYPDNKWHDDYRCRQFVKTKMARQLWILANEFEFASKEPVFCETAGTSQAAPLARDQNWITDVVYAPVISCNISDGNRCKRLQFHPKDNFILAVMRDWKSFTFIVSCFRGARNGKEQSGRIIHHYVSSCYATRWLDATWNPNGNAILCVEFSSLSARIKLFTFNKSYTSIDQLSFVIDKLCPTLQISSSWIDENSFWACPLFTVDDDGKWRTSLILDCYTLNLESSGGGMLSKQTVTIPSLGEEVVLPPDLIRISCGVASTTKAFFAFATVKCKSPTHFSVNLTVDENEAFYHHVLKIYHAESVTIAATTGVRLVKIISLNSFVLDTHFDYVRDSIVIAFYTHPTYYFKSLGTTGHCIAITASTAAECSQASVCKHGEIAPRQFNLRENIQIQIFQLNLAETSLPCISGSHLCQSPETDLFLRTFHKSVTPNHLICLHSPTDECFLLGNYALGRTYTLFRHFKGVGGKKSFSGLYIRHSTKPFYIKRRGWLGQQNFFEICLMPHDSPRLQQEYPPSLTSYYNNQKRLKLENNSS